MQNSAVVPSQSDPSFAQQGTVDWTQLARSTVTLSLEVLSRLNQAGVETFTLAVGQAVFSPFLIPPESQRKIQSVLSDLKPFSSYGNILWFGFGIKHVVRLLVESEEGIACVALCGGLAVSYDKFYCAQVLRCLTEHQSAPSHLKPSILQWSNLINVCSGSLATSDFSNIVEGLCLLWNDKDLDYRKQRGATTPAALAKALTTLSAVSCGAIHSATFAGGPDCAWLAALAEWVLGLTVEVRDAETGQCLYRKMGGAQYDTPQVTVLRALNAQSSTLQLKDKTCFLPTGAEMFRDNADAVERIFAGGRSTWDSILADSLPAEPLQRLFSPEAAPSFSIILHNAFEGMKQEVADTRGFFDILPELKPILLHSRTEKQTVDEAVDILYEPEFTPEREPFFHVVPGHIQKDGTFFRGIYDLSAKYALQVESVLISAKSFDDMVDLTLGNSQKRLDLSLMVIQTLDSQKLAAGYVWQTSRRENARHNFHAFSSANLQQRIFDAPNYPLCTAQNIRARRSNKALIGRCSQISKDLRHQMPCGARPWPGQWVLVDAFDSKNAKTPTGATIYMGSLATLYSIICSCDPFVKLKLKLARVCATGCLFCTCPTEAREITIISSQTAAAGVLFAGDIE
ncbi:hypothetical protein BJY04DRAFT_214221 [Aspergillus karnatakaensis]|uniref:uncharacterized protein n=1 Tax=Aspergillus karnatakaensis TaxID=1810916 RepID=UPI003CCDA250